MFYGIGNKETDETVEQAMTVKGIVSDLYVFLNVDPGGSGNYVFTVRRDPKPAGIDGGDVGDTSITCTIDGNADSTGRFWSPDPAKHPVLSCRRSHVHKDHLRG